MTNTLDNTVTGELEQWPPVDLLDEPVDVDFDEAWAERKRKAPRIRVLGTVYTLPQSMPAKLILFVAQSKMRGERSDRDVQMTEMVDMFETLLGKDNLAELLAKGIGLDELGDILGRCLEMYRKRSGQGEAPAPAAGAPETTG